MDVRDKLVYPAAAGALYAALTMLLAPISYGPLQLRLAEALCVLPFFAPWTAAGLFLGCALSNLLSAAGLLDVVFGSLATLLAGVLTARLGRDYRVTGGFPSLGRRLAACMTPVGCNGVIVGAVLSASFTPEAFWPGFFLSGAQVAFSEALVLLFLGLPLMRLLPRLLSAAGNTKKRKNC